MIKPLKIGGTFYLRVPREIISKYKISDNQDFEVSFDDSQIVFTLTEKDVALNNVIIRVSILLGVKYKVIAELVKSYEPYLSSSEKGSRSVDAEDFADKLHNVSKADSIIKRSALKLILIHFWGDSVSVHKILDECMLVFDDA